MGIQFSSSVLLVKDIHSSRSFYETLLEQKVEIDHGACVAFYGGFSIWQREHAHGMMKIEHMEPVVSENNPCFELYFETEDLDTVQKRLTDEKVEFVHEIYEQPWGQRVFRVFDPDKHIVEMGEPMTAVVKRYLKSGMQPEEVAVRSSMPIDFVKSLVEG